MIWFCIGTSGELIKVYSLIHYCREKNIPWWVAGTGQSGIHFLKQWDDFELPREKIFFLNDSSEDLRSSVQAASWFFRGFLRTGVGLAARILDRTGVVPDPKKDVWVVHGDTLSSIMGAEYGIRLGLRVAHVESGMTSGSILEPFPEELCRRWTSRRAQFCFAPDEEAKNGLLLRKVRGQVICTQGNTLMDSVRVVTQAVEARGLPKNNYALVNVHRYENLHSPSRWSHIVDTLLRAAEGIQLIVVLHPGTEEKINSDSSLKQSFEKKGVVLMPRGPFSQFVHLVANAQFLLSDGGSNQQESSYLGVPCLILRDRTESREGMTTNCVLSRFNDEVIGEFLKNPHRYRFARSVGESSPARRVMEALTQL